MANRELNKIFKQYWQTALSFSPMSATFSGVHKYDHLLDDCSKEGEKKYITFLTTTAKSLRAISNKNLNEKETLNKNLLLDSISESKKAAKFPGRHLAISQMGGVHLNFLRMAEMMPFEKPKHFDNYCKRLTAFTVQLSQIQELLSEGLEIDWTIPKPAIKAVISQVADLIKPGRQSRFYKIIQKSAKKLPQDRRSKEESRFSQIIKNEVNPALTQFLDFLRKTYLKKTRDTGGLCHLPNGLEYYQWCISHHVTTAHTADEIHKIGKSEVKRIHTEMNQIKKNLGFKGTLSAFFQHLRKQPQYHYKSRSELLKDHRKHLNDMNKKLPDYFGRLPKNPYEVKPIESFQEKASPDAFYMPGNLKLKRPGVYFANTYQPETRARFNAEVLAFHEAVPGHHLQISIANELKSLPEFRKHGGATSFIEGWALYTEKLAEEMGFYKDPLSVFGKLSFEVWRACRLVIDTGIHAHGWSKAKAISYFKKNTALSLPNIENEVDRYMVMPGQALSYKMGEIFITGLRQKLEKKLKERFNLSRFHDRLLENGALPLRHIEKIMMQWAKNGGK